MKIKRNQSIPVLKIFFILVFLFSNCTFIYGQDEDEEVQMQDAKVTLTFSEEEEVNTIKALATDLEGLPIEELDLYFYVQRTFSLLPIGDTFNTTDENGEVEVVFPNDLPADEEGNVKIIVKIFESDLYNDLSVEVTKKWGIPTEIDHSGEKRSLWAAAANAPLSLIFLTLGIIFAIWFVNCYIMYVLYQISRIKPLKS